MYHAQAKSLLLRPEKVLLVPGQTPSGELATTVAVGSLLAFNNNEDHMAFRVGGFVSNKPMGAGRTEGSSKYCVYPEFGKILPGGCVRVTVKCEMREDWKEADSSCLGQEDGFILTSVIIPQNRHGLAQYDIWNSPEIDMRRDLIFEQKINVAFLGALDRMTPVAHLPVDTDTNTRGKWLGVTGTVQRMGIIFQPAHTICFQRPLSRPISRSLVIGNLNPHSIVFKIKTKTPGLYFTRPTCGIVAPGESIHVTIESRPLSQDPPPDYNSKVLKHIFRVDAASIAPEQMNLPIDEILARKKDKVGLYSHKLDVAYISAEGLTPEETTEYAAGAAPAIPDELFLVYPAAALCFKWPPSDLKNTTQSLLVTNVYSRPIAIKVKVTDSKMYFVHPSSGRIESGGRLKLRDTALQVVRRPILDEPPLVERYSDEIAVQGTVIKAGQENVALGDIWEAIEDEAKEVYRQRIPVLFIPFSGLTPEEEAIRDQRGPYDRLVAADLHRGLYEGSDPGQDECEPEAPTMRHPYNVNPLSIRKWLRSIVNAQSEGPVGSERAPA